MAERSSLPGVSSQILDGGLNISQPRANLNSSILVIGTAEDGPLYEPIPLNIKEDASQVFGRFGKGTLVRGINEAFDAQTGNPDVRAMRVGNGKKAFLEVEELAGSGKDAETTGHNALRLESLFPGGIYNKVSIGLDEQRRISIFNPKTGIFSLFTFDKDNPNNSNVDAHNVRELADAINADPNMSTILRATVSGVAANFEISVNSGSDGINVLNGITTLTLHDGTTDSVLEAYTTAAPGDVQATGFFVGTPQVAETAGNLLDELEAVYALTLSGETEISTAGKTAVGTELNPLDGKSDSRLDTIMALEKYSTSQASGVFPFIRLSPSGNVVSEFVQVVNRQNFNQYPTASGGESNANTITYNMFWSPDDSEETLMTTGTSGSAASGYIVSNRSTFIDYLPFSGITNWERATTEGMTKASGFLRVEVSRVDNNDEANWTTLPIDPVSGVYLAGSGAIGTLDSNNIRKVTLSVGSAASGWTGAPQTYTDPQGRRYVDMGILVDTAGQIRSDVFVRMTCFSIKGFLSEKENLPALEAASSDWTGYFFRGNELLFSDVVPTNLLINHAVKIDFEPGRDVEITDSDVGELRFSNKELQPGPGGAALDATDNSVIGFQYRYLPQWVNITTSFVSLNDGTSGDNPGNKVLFEEFARGYNAVRNYEVDIVTPMGANIDSTKKTFNKITGLPEVVNAQFQEQLAEFLDDVSTNVNETIGMMGVTSPTGETQAEVNDWVDRLTIQDLSDPTRGANILPLINSRFINIVAFEPRFDNIGGLAYTANGQSAYAGMVASLPAQQSPLNKGIPFVSRTRFNLSKGQLEALTGVRLVTAKDKTGQNPVITDAITAAAPGSDFTKLTTVRITFAAMDVVREVADPYIGQPNTAARRNAMDTAIAAGLQRMVERGALRAYDFKIRSSPTQQVLGVVEIELILVPIFEIRQIRATVKLRTSIET